MRRPPALLTRRSPAPRPELPAPHVAEVRPRDPTARFSTHSRSSFGRFHSSPRKFRKEHTSPGYCWKVERRVGGPTHERLRDSFLIAAIRETALPPKEPPTT